MECHLQRSSRVFTSCYSFASLFRVDMSTISKPCEGKAPPIARAYWVCQFAGWCAVLSFQMFVLTAFGREVGPLGPKVYGAAALLDASGFLLSHLFYLHTRRRHWLQMPPRRAWPRLFAVIALAAT